MVGNLRVFEPRLATSFERRHKEDLGINESSVDPYGKYKCKLGINQIKKFEYHKMNRWKQIRMTMSTDSGKRSLYGCSLRPYTVNREKFNIRNLRNKMFNTMKVHKEKDFKSEGRYVKLSHFKS